MAQSANTNTTHPTRLDWCGPECQNQYHTLPDWCGPECQNQYHTLPDWCGPECQNQYHTPTGLVWPRVPKPIPHTNWCGPECQNQHHTAYWTGVAQSAKTMPQCTTPKMPKSQCHTPYRTGLKLNQPRMPKPLQPTPLTKPTLRAQNAKTTSLHHYNYISKNRAWTRI